MIKWKEANSELCKIYEVELFAKLVNNWKPLISFTKKFFIDALRGFEYASAVVVVLKSGICYFCTSRLQLEMLNVLGFFRL